MADIQGEAFARSHGLVESVCGSSAGCWADTAEKCYRNFHKNFLPNLETKLLPHSVLDKFRENLNGTEQEYFRDGLKGGPVLLSNSQTWPGKNFMQPRLLLLAHLCTLSFAQEIIHPFPSDVTYRAPQQARLPSHPSGAAQAALPPPRGGWGWWWGGRGGGSGMAWWRALCAGGSHQTLFW